MLIVPSKDKDKHFVDNAKDANETEGDIGNGDKHEGEEDDVSAKEDASVGEGIGGNTEETIVRDSKFLEISPVGKLPFLPKNCLFCDLTLSVELNKNDTTPPVPPLRNRKLLIGLTVAPDLSGINFGGNQLGARTSLSLEYAVTDRFYITSGIGLSKKRYLADISDYKVRPGFWTNGEVPEEVDADCNVLEIPIGIRYDFWKNGDKRWFCRFKY